MHKQASHTAKSIRFRRWSRAGYAIFCSLTCSVTIGCVAISISDKSLQKAIGTSSSVLCIVGADADSEEKDTDELEAVLQQGQETNLFKQHLTALQRVVKLHCIFLIIIAVEMG